MLQWENEIKRAMKSHELENLSKLKHAKIVKARLMVHGDVAEV